MYSKAAVTSLWPRLCLESLDGEIELEFSRILFLSRFIWGKIYVGDHSFMVGETADAVPWLSWQQCLSFTSAVDGGSTSAVGLLATWKVRAEKVLKSEFVSKKWHVAHVFTLTAASFKTGSHVNEICAQLSLLAPAYCTFYTPDIDGLYLYWWRVNNIDGRCFYRWRVNI